MSTQFFSFQSPSNAHYQTSPPAIQKRKRSSSVAFSPSEVGNTTRDLSTSGRTIKRTRARPNEELVHQYTLQKLFSAAKAIPHTEKQHIHEQPAASSPQHTQQPRSFFSLFQRLGNTPVQAPVQVGLSCEDCDRDLGAYEDEEEVRCLGCHRIVCDLGCSASNGMGRVCLECARCR